MKRDAIVICGAGISVRVEFRDDLVADISLSKGSARAETSAGKHAAVYGQFKRYLRGENVRWDIPLDREMLTPFQKKVFGELEKVPYGQTVTYEELAVRVKNKNYRRAVAMALSANPFPLVMPCHRVLAKNGLGGFSCGTDIKIKLLEREGIKTRR